MVPRNPQERFMHLPQKEGGGEGEVEERRKEAERGEREDGEENKGERISEREKKKPPKYEKKFTKKK